MLLNYPIVPLLASLGLLTSFLGVTLIGISLYQGIPFVGETLGDSSKNPITRHERLRIKSIGLGGLWLIFAGFVMLAAAWWLEWGLSR